MLVSQGDFNRIRLAYRHNVDVTAMGEFGVLLRLRRGGGSKNLRGCVKGERGLFYVHSVIDEKGRGVKRFVHGANQEQETRVESQEKAMSQEKKESEELEESEDKWRGDHKEKDYRRKANYGEMKVDIDLESSKKFKRVNESTRILDLDQPTRQGIDAIYKNANSPPSYVIVEVKTTSSDEDRIPSMGMTEDGLQMSDGWVENRIAKAVSGCPKKIKEDFGLYEDSSAKDKDSSAKDKDSSAKDKDSSAKDKDSSAKDKDSSAKDKDSSANDKNIKDLEEFVRVVAHVKTNGQIKYYLVDNDGKAIMEDAIEIDEKTKKEKKVRKAKEWNPNALKGV